MVFISISEDLFRVVILSVWLLTWATVAVVQLGVHKACKLIQFAHNVHCDEASVKQLAKNIAIGFNLLWALWAIPFVVRKFLLKRVTTNKKVINDLETILLPIFKAVATDVRFAKMFTLTYSNGKRTYAAADLYYTTKFIRERVDSRYSCTKADHDSLLEVCKALNTMRCDNGHICLDKWITNADVESAVKNAKMFVHLIANRKKTIDVNDAKLFQFVKDMVFRGIGLRLSVYDKATKNIEALKAQWISEMKKNE